MGIEVTHSERCLLLSEKHRERCQHGLLSAEQRFAPCTPLLSDLGFTTHYLILFAVRSISISCMKCVTLSNSQRSP